MRLAWLTGVLLCVAPSMVSASDTCVCWTGLDAPTSELSPQAMRFLTERASALEEDARRAPGAGVARAPTAPLVDALSRPLDEIASLPPLPPAERVLWCDGADDPRCTPGNPAPTSAEVANGPPAAHHGLTSHTPPRRVRATRRHATTGLVHAPGSIDELDRPPQA